MRTAPVGFVKSLQLMDAALSVRWSEGMGAWVIERLSHLAFQEVKYLERRATRMRFKVESGQATVKDKADYFGIVEELISARAGKRVIKFATKLDAALYNELCLGDIQRYGGYSRFADEIEKQEEVARQETVRTQQNHREAINHEVFGRRGIYDFLADKKGVHKKEQIRRGEKTIAQALGTSDPWWEQKDLPPPPKLVDEFGKELIAA